MPLVKVKPTSPGRRAYVKVTNPELHKGEPYAPLLAKKDRINGRNNHGRITSRFRGGGHKQAYRKVDFKRTRRDDAATVERIEYDPNRTAFIALVKYKDGEKKVVVPPGTVIAKYVPGGPEDLKVGAKVFVGGATKQADGTLLAPNIAVGRDIDPPQ